MSEEEIRIGRTEALFRDVNERIAESAQRFEADETQFVCECADPSCADRIELSLEDYERVREDATHFVLVEGHVDERVERVITQRRKYSIVEKFNSVVRKTVVSLDPRAEPA